MSQVVAAVKQHVRDLPGAPKDGHRSCLGWPGTHRSACYLHLPATGKVHKRSSDDDDDAPKQLPFSSGTTVALSDPTLSNDDGYDCDVTTTSPWPGPSGSGAAGGGFLERVSQALGGLVGGGGKGGDADDSPFVQCDHDASADSSSFWKRTGFMVRAPGWPAMCARCVQRLVCLRGPAADAGVLHRGSPPQVLADYAQWAPIKEGDAVDLRSAGTFKFWSVVRNVT